MKVLITGGAGFIGCELGSLLIEKYDAEVIAYDNLLEQVHPSGKLPLAFPQKAKFIKNDVRDAKAWREFFAEYDPEYIVHLAAETGTAQSLTESARHASVNATGTAEMLDAMTANGKKPKKILLSSSRSIYGEGAWAGEDGKVFYPGRRNHKMLASGKWDFTTPDGKPAKALEQDGRVIMANPTSIYGATKLAQENILSSWCEAFNVPLAILRFQNVYGPGQSPYNPYTGIINIFHRIAYSGKPIEVYEDGAIGRDFVLVKDVVNSCASALLTESDETIMGDIGYGKVTTILDAARIISKIHNAPEPVICGKFRDGDVRWAVANNDVMVNKLGVQPTVDFEEGAKLVGDWLMANNYIA